MVKPLLTLVETASPPPTPSSCSFHQNGEHAGPAQPGCIRRVLHEYALAVVSQRWDDALLYCQQMVQMAVELTDATSTELDRQRLQKLS